MRLLVVEDEPQLAAQLVAALRRHEYAVDHAGDGMAAVYQGFVTSYDAVVLDLGLPGLDGLSVLKQWRARGIAVPVIILTARGTWHERVDGMDAGADDYIVKPFHMEELLARVRAVLRRAARNADPDLRSGALTLDTRSGRVALGQQVVDLTAYEFRILSYLMHHRERAVSRTEVLEHVYAEDRDRDSNTIEVFIGRLRRKIGAGYIVTLRGRGYRIGDGT